MENAGYSISLLSNLKIPYRSIHLTSIVAHVIGTQKVLPKSKYAFLRKSAIWLHLCVDTLKTLAEQPILKRMQCEKNIKDPKLLVRKKKGGEANVWETRVAIAIKQALWTSHFKPCYYYYQLKGIQFKLNTHTNSSQRKKFCKWKEQFQYMMYKIS